MFHMSPFGILEEKNVWKFFFPSAIWFCTFILISNCVQYICLAMNEWAFVRDEGWNIEQKLKAKANNQWTQIEKQCYFYILDNVSLFRKIVRDWWKHDRNPIVALRWTLNMNTKDEEPVFHLFFCVHPLALCVLCSDSKINIIENQKKKKTYAKN